MLAIIGGSGLTQLSNMEIERREVVRTPYGEPSGALAFGRVCDEPVVFLARHGYGHTIPPHLVNYRANIWALKQAKATGIVSVASVGGIRADLAPGTLIVPNQIIDYTWGRKSTFFEGGDTPVRHIDFTEPYDETLRHRLLAAPPPRRRSASTAASRTPAASCASTACAPASRTRCGPGSTRCTSCATPLRRSPGTPACCTIAPNPTSRW